MEYLVRLAQAHESFRRPELEALADHEGIHLEILDYDPDSPFCIIRLRPKPGFEGLKDDTTLAKSFMSRSILSQGIYELWGRGVSYEDLHEDVKSRSQPLWEQYRDVPFKFMIDTYCGKRSMAQRAAIVDTFKYLDFRGKITMTNPDFEFTVFEEWEDHGRLTREQNQAREKERAERGEERKPVRLFFGRYVGGSRRKDLIEKHDLKKRPYISTTSMDAELALLTANLALAAPGKLFADPFVGTGGFLVAAAELGAFTLGSDIDGRSYRGKGPGLDKGVGANFRQYGLTSLFGDCMTADLTHTPFRSQTTYVGKHDRWLDGIISDPPYGVREGLKVLGTKHSKLPGVRDMKRNNDDADPSDPMPPPPPMQPVMVDGVPAHTRPDYVAPKKPYSFTRLLDDVLAFAARTLVDGGRLAFWMPSANHLDEELTLPSHPLLELRHVCVQAFNKWSRRLLVFERLPGDLAAEHVPDGPETSDGGTTANDLNPFRKMYFQRFQGGAKSAVVE